MKAESLRTIVSGMSTSGEDATKDDNSIGNDSTTSGHAEHTSNGDVASASVSALKFNDDSLHWTCKVTRTGASTLPTTQSTPPFGSDCNVTIHYDCRCFLDESSPIQW